MQFYEYFHGDNSLGLGAADQAGWTGLLANLVLRCYKQDIADFDTGNEDQNRIQKKKKAVA